jgi:hypothetical protein
MPRFYFDYFQDGELTGLDTEGTQLPDRAAVRLEAGVSMGELSRDLLRKESPDRRFGIKVREEHGQYFLECKLSFEVLDLEKAS